MTCVSCFRWWQTACFVFSSFTESQHVFCCCFCLTCSFFCPTESCLFCWICLQNASCCWYIYNTEICFLLFYRKPIMQMRLYKSWITKNNIEDTWNNALDSQKPQKGLCFSWCPSTRHPSGARKFICSHARNFALWGAWTTGSTTSSIRPTRDYKETFTRTHSTNLGKENTTKILYELLSSFLLHFRLPTKTCY